MPSVNKQSEPVDVALKEWADFENGFKRSRKGNLWQVWRGQSISVFFRRDGFAWSVTNDDFPEFSPHNFKTENDAIQALGESLLVGFGYQ